MPLDRNFDNLYDETIWELKFVWFPRRCEILKRRIWLRWAYCGKGEYIGPGCYSNCHPYYRRGWHSKMGHVIWILKNNG